MPLITLGSGRGGMGRSFLAANLGWALARRGVMTCLVDLNFRSADLHLFLGQLETKRGLLGLLRGEIPTISDVMVPVEGMTNLFLVPGPRESQQLNGLGAREVERLISALREGPIPFVIVDLAPGLSHQVLDLFLCGEEQLLVTTADAGALADAARFLRLARLRGAARDAGRMAGSDVRPRVYTSLDDLVRDMNSLRSDSVKERNRVGFRPTLVFNRCNETDRARCSEWHSALVENLGGGVLLPVRGEIPDDPAAERACRLFAPVHQLFPGSPSSLAVDSLAGRLVEPAGPVQEVTEWPKPLEELAGSLLP